jgi:hypothetical protein
MRKLISSIVLVGTTILMLLPVQPLQPVQRVQALPENEVYYTVRVSCIVSPWYPIGTIVGEWTRQCNGSLSGWGSQPFSGCTTTEITAGPSCPGGPLDPLDP